MLPWSPGQARRYGDFAAAYGFEGAFTTVRDTRPGDRAWIYRAQVRPGIIGAIEFVTIASPSKSHRWVAWGHAHLFDRPRTRDSLVRDGAPWFRGPPGPKRLTANKAAALGDLMDEVPWASPMVPAGATDSLGSDERRLWAPIDELPAWRSARELATAVIARPSCRSQLHLRSTAKVPRRGGSQLTLKNGSTTVIFTLDADLDCLETLMEGLNDDGADRQGHLVAGRSLTVSVMSGVRRIPGGAAWVCSRIGQAPRLERAIWSRRRLAPL